MFLEGASETLGVTKDEGDDEWWFEDCRGEDNADPDTNLLDVAADVVDSCTDAERSPRRDVVKLADRSGSETVDLFASASARVAVA